MATRRGTLRQMRCLGYLLGTLTLALALLLAACRGRGTLEAPGSADAPAASPVGPGYRADQPKPPMPTVTAVGAGPTAAILGSPVPEPFLSVISSATTVANSGAPGWACYRSINEAWRLLFARDSALWAITNGGLVRWDLEANAYIQYGIKAGDMALAPDGGLLLATEHGLCRFDGTKCVLVGDGGGPSGKAIHALAVTPEGVVWIGTEAGVSRFDGQTWKNYPSNVSTYDLAIENDGKVWAATAGGLGLYLSSQDTWRTLTEKDGMPSLQATAVAIGPAGDVWVSVAWQGLYRFDGKRWQPVEGVPGGIVSDLAFASDGTPWVSTIGSLHYPGGSLAYRNGERWVDVTSQQGLTSIRAIAVGPGDMVAASTNLGLGIYKEGDWRLLRDGPLTDRVTSVAVTPDGSAWFAFGDYSVSTTGSGLSRFDGQEWRYYLDDGEVNVLAVAPDGSLWAGVGSSLQRFDGGNWQTVAQCEDLPPGNVSSIAFAADGTVWVANGFGLARYDGASWVVYDRLANAVLAAPDGSIWVNGWDGAQGSDYVARFDGETWTTYKSADAFPGRFVVSAVTPDGLAWGIVPERGLASFDGRSWNGVNSWEVYAPPEGVSLEGSLALAEAPDGAIWMRTTEGVARFDPAAARSELDEDASSGAWTQYSALDGQCGSSYWPIAFGPEGEIWFGSSRFQPVESPQTSEGEGLH